MVEVGNVHPVTDHDLARADLRSLLDEMKEDVGPPDPAMVGEAEAMLGRLGQRAQAAKRRAVD